MILDEEAKDTYDLLNTYGSLKKVLECIKSKSTSIYKLGICQQDAAFIYQHHLIQIL